MPGTPGARPPSQPPMPSFGSQQSQNPSAFGLSGGASSFTPRKSAAIAIRRPDGSVLETKPTPSSSTPAVSGTSVAPAATTSPLPTAPKTKAPFPVMVRIESEAARKERLAEEATLARCLKEDEKYEAEKKERKARQAREAEEKRVAADEAKAKEASEKVSPLPTGHES